MKLRSHHGFTFKFKSSHSYFQTSRLAFLKANTYLHMWISSMKQLTECNVVSPVLHLVRNLQAMWQVKQDSASPHSAPHWHHQHHPYSHIYVTRLSNQILGCVHSAVALYINYKPVYMYWFIIPFYALELPTWKRFGLFKVHSLSLSLWPNT